METINDWFSIYFVVWIIVLVVFTWIPLWFKSHSASRFRDALSIPFKQFVIQVKLTPEEVKHRLIEAIEPITILRMPFTFNNEAYEGQWLMADRFELHRLIPRNAWFAYGEIFPYPQDTILIKVTLKTSVLWLVPVVLFLLNPILLGILATAIPPGRAIEIADMIVFMPTAFFFCCIPGSFMLIVLVATYSFTLNRETEKVRVFLGKVFATI